MMACGIADERWSDLLPTENTWRLPGKRWHYERNPVQGWHHFRRVGECAVKKSLCFIRGQDFGKRGFLQKEKQCAGIHLYWEARSACNCHGPDVQKRFSMRNRRFPGVKGQFLVSEVNIILLVLEPVAVAYERRAAEKRHRFQRSGSRVVSTTLFFRIGELYCHNPDQLI